MLERINKILKGQIVTSVLYTVLGLCFVLMPVDTVNILCKFVFGVVLILAGVYHILIYVLERMNATLLDLLSGGMILVIGIFLFFNPQIVVKLLPVLLGTFVLVDSIWVLKGSLKLKKIGRGEWKVLMIGSLVFIGLGIAMIVDPFDMVKYTMIFAGCVMLANGVTDIVFLVLMRRGIKKQKRLWKRLWKPRKQWMLSFLRYRTRRRLNSRSRSMHHGVLGQVQRIPRRNIQLNNKILVIEDDRAISELLCMNLNAAGYEILNIEKTT